MGDDFHQLGLRDAIVQRPLHMEGQLLIAVQRDECGNRDQAAFTRWKARSLPDVIEQHLISQFGKFGGDVAHQFAGDGAGDLHGATPKALLTSTRYPTIFIHKIR